MYHVDVKAVTFTIPEDLDRRAAKEARRRGISKSELIRQGLHAVLPDAAEDDGEDLWLTLAGFGSPDVSIAPGEIDDIVYGT